MLYSSLIVAATALVSFASAQSSGSGPSGRTLANPGRVPIAVRTGWCQAERDTCPLICGADGTTENNCDENLLTYSCICRAGNQPNISDYAQTLPAAICQSDIDLCIQDNPNDAAAQSNCRTITCGRRNASTTTTTSESSSPSSTSASSTSARASGSATGSASGSAASPSNTSAAMALSMARNYGTPALLAGLMAAFGLLV